MLVTNMNKPVEMLDIMVTFIVGSGLSDFTDLVSSLIDMKSRSLQEISELGQRNVHQNLCWKTIE